MPNVVNSIIILFIYKKNHLTFETTFFQMLLHSNNQSYNILTPKLLESMIHPKLQQCVLQFAYISILCIVYMSKNSRSSVDTSNKLKDITLFRLFWRIKVKETKLGKEKKIDE